jgi:hypothetical protein
VKIQKAATRSNSIRVVMSDEEKRKLVVVAEYYDVSQSQLVRDLLAFAYETATNKGSATKDSGR